MTRRRVATGVVVAAAAVVAVPVLLLAGAAAAIAGDGEGDRGRTSSTPGTMVEVPPVLLPGVPAGGYPTLTYDYGQCTYWAALNHSVTWSGDAYQWATLATRAGAPVAHAPTVGAVAVYARGSGYDARYGHVAIVVAIGTNTYTVTEMNVLRPGSGAVDERTIPWPDPRVEAFIV
jgi:hypothetical protein